jgi:hypothetical protein
VAPEHQAACHFAEDALQSDVGVAHVREGAATRRGTPESATAGLEAEHAAAGVTAAASAPEPSPSIPSGEPEG